VQPVLAQENPKTDMKGWTMTNHSMFVVKRTGLSILSLLLLLAISCHTVNPPAIAWVKKFTGDGEGEGRSVQPTADGGFILAGTTTRNSDGLQQIYLVRTDGNGDAIWTRRFDDPDPHHTQSSTSYGTAGTTDDGGIIVAGALSWSDSGSMTNSTIYVVRTDGNGDTLWTRRYGNGLFPSVSSVQQTTDGGYVIAGGSGKPEAPTFLLRLDSGGDSLWLRLYGSGYSTSSGGGRQTTDGGFVVATSQSDQTMEMHACLVKTDGSGETVWSLTSTARGSTSANAVAQSTDGGYVTAGARNNTVGFWTNVHDMYLMKVSASGQLQWEKNFGPGSNQEALTVLQAADGGYAVGGWTSGSSFVGGPCVVKTDPKGNPVWSDTLGVGWGQTNSICQTADGGYVLAGQAQDTIHRAAVLAKLNPQTP
jgi:hypothetical protein